MRNPTRMIMALLGGLLVVMVLVGCSPETPDNKPATETDGAIFPSTSPEPIQPASPRLNVVGHLNPGKAPGHITDVWAMAAAGGRSYAYLGTSGQPDCDTTFTGVHIIDITDAAMPRNAGFIPAPPGTRVNDIKTARLTTPFFSGDLLAHSLEICTRDPAAGRTLGVSLYDITDPVSPRLLAQGFLDFQVHNIFIYQQGARAFMLIVEDGGERDFHLVEITDPLAPLELTSAGWGDWFDADTDQLFLGEAAIPFLHDVWAEVYPTDAANARFAGRTIAFLSYWDAGLVLLDITDPTAPVFLGDSDYTTPDPVSGQPPEGNSHVAVPADEGRLVFMGDEDFSTTSDETGIFNGWGYGRILDVSNPESIVEVGQFTVENTLFEPPPPGEHSMHNVVVDGSLAYISWYGDGIRVVDFSQPEKPSEVAHFIDSGGGSDFWGVYLFRHPDGNSYILGSDRSSGLWILDPP